MIYTRNIYVLTTGEESAQQSTLKIDYYNSLIYNSTTQKMYIPNATGMSIPNGEEGIWNVNTGSIITAFYGSYSKVGMQVILGASVTLASTTSVNVILPFAPQYGNIYTIGKLTITITGGSKTASIVSSEAGVYQFNINYKTA